MRVLLRREDVRLGSFALGLNDLTDALQRLLPLVEIDSQPKDWKNGIAAGSRSADTGMGKSRGGRTTVFVLDFEMVTNRPATLQRDGS